MSTLERAQEIRADFARVLARLDALIAELSPVARPEPAAAVAPMAWGAKVSSVFRDRVRWIVEDLSIGESQRDGCDKLMTCMAWESGRSFRPDVKNMAGSGATGLIQFMPLTALGFFYSAAEIEAMTETERKTRGVACCDKLAAMTAEDQLNFVWRYFKPYKGRLKSLGDVYMAILWPAGVGKPESYVLWSKETRPTTFRQNAGLDVNKDGTITKAEATAKVAALLEEGRRPGNMA